MNKPLMIHTCPNEPDYDFRAFTVTERICAEVVDTQNKAIVAACIRAAEKAGITQLYLLDKQFVTEAIWEKVTREMAKEDDDAQTD